jgi:hypothetical protein
MIGRRDGHTDEDEASLREWALPEEMVLRAYSPWTGSSRWFKSDNVLPLEQYRSAEEWASIRARFWPRR